MWLLNQFFAPELPTWRRYEHIEACHRVAIFEWLIRWADKVETYAEDLYSSYPFACHTGPEPVATTIGNARKTLVELMSEPYDESILSVLDYEIAKFANILASWRGRTAPPFWDRSSFHALTDLTKYEP